MAPTCDQAQATMHAPSAAGEAIPDEILMDIFMRLPARSVGRCRCLSRAWAAALAPSDDFTDRHFRAANSRPSLFVLPVPSAGVTAVSAWSPDQPRGTTLVAFPRRPMRNAGTRPCRGLIVMEEEDPPARATDASVYYVCNPSTGQMTALPEGRPVPPQPSRYEASDRRRCYDSLGIGYDAVSCKFKVVRVVCRYGDDDYLPDCDVYVVDDGFCWRPAMGDAELPEEFGYTSSYEPSVSAQGHLYWMSEPEGPFKDKHVISFSLSGETFGVIQPPSRCSKYGLTKLEGRACLFSTVSSVHQPHYYIWLLRYDDVASSARWDLRCRINLAAAPPDVKRFMACLVRPLAFMDGGSRILFRPGVAQSTNDSNPVHKLCSYAPATGAMEELLADGSLVAMPSQNGSATTKAVVYEESLVSTGRPHEEILYSSTSARALCIALHRLPAPDLGQLKLVCREWRAVIETERFINLHSRYARATRRSPLYVFFPDAASEDRRPGSSLLNTSPKLLDDRVVSCKPCHGLLLVTSFNGDNVRVLSPVIDEEMAFSCVADKGVRRSRGMGYDKVTEGHVMVTVEFASGASAMECRLWRFKEDVRRTLTCPPSIRVCLDVPPVYVDGKMYWMGKPSGHHDQRKDNMIMVLDIHTEAFEVMPAPRAEDCCRMIVAELAGRLCVAHPCAHTESLTIWSMNNKLDPTNVAGQGWTTEHVIDLSWWSEFSPKTAAALVVPVDVDTVGDGRILLDTGRAVGLYDPRERTMHTVYSLNWRPGKLTDKFVAVALWEDSLVRPPQGGGQPDRWYRDV